MDAIDSTLSVKFFLHPQLNEKATKETGMPVIEQVEMVSIVVPGNRNAMHAAPANEVHFNSNTKSQMTYAERFPEVYAAFQQGVEAQAQGTPLQNADFIIAQPGILAEMHGKSIFTVEQLAGMSDANIRKAGMGFRENVNAAKAYLAERESAAALAARVAELEAQVAAAEPAVEPVAVEEPAAEPDFSAYSDDDLKNMIRDAGGEVPRGAASRDTLIKRLNELAEAAE